MIANTSSDVVWCFMIRSDSWLFLYRHELLHSFSLHLFAKKRPVEPITDMESFRRSLPTRLNVGRSVDDLAFTFVDVRARPLAGWNLRVSVGNSKAGSARWRAMRHRA